MAARGSAKWQGDLKGGAGEFTAGDGISGQYSFRTRFEAQPGANPEQLIGAALASCFSMALANTLSQQGNVPESISTEARVSIEPVDGKPSISRIDLVTRGVVAGLADDDFQKAASETKDTCIVSRALAGVPEMTLHAELSS